MTSLYDIIWDYFHQYIFNTNNDLLAKNGNINLFGVTGVSISEYLSTFCTWIIIGLIILFFVKLTIWIFKLFGGLFKW